MADRATAGSTEGHAVDHRDRPLITIVTYNIRTVLGRDGWDSWPFRRRTTATVLRNLQPDVAATQEGWRCQVRDLVRQLPGFTCAGVGRNNGSWWGEHCAVLFRTDRFTLDRQATRWFSDTPDVPGSRSWGNALPRIVTMVWLTDRADGTRVGVANAHLDEVSEAVRDRSTAALLEWIAAGGTGDDRRWLIVGDLNATATDPSVRRVLDAGWRDALAPLPATGDDAGTLNRFTGRRDGPRIDHILLDSGWTVVDGTVGHDRPGGRLGSDHWPVVARLR
jgi:endonuclease/exonuclease/phosphatase family metal-dependent hydrolase